MKCKVTMREVRKNYRTIIAIGYCEAQYLLQYETPFAYSAGVYGWDCDYYDIDGVCISIGYRPIGKPIDYEKLREAEAAAREIWDISGLDYESMARSVKAVLLSLIDALNS